MRSKERESCELSKEKRVSPPPYNYVMFFVLQVKLILTSFGRRQFAESRKSLRAFYFLHYSFIICDMLNFSPYF